ncbi:MAG: DEDD exonuclease domain-containing protein [Actinobacteria bacterium]|nr:DEDD exonuclease domain-containing protein [Actinomycetota bacterium]
MSPSLYGFVRGREPASPEEIAARFLSLPESNGDARAHVERLIENDPRFLWDGGRLRTVDLASLALEDVPYVVFDLETTGASAGKGGITELGALKLLRGQVVDQFSTLVNPGRPIEPFVVRLTGITDRMVADAPVISEVMPRFEEFIEGSVLVGHNVHFDCSFVTAAREGALLPNPVLDTLRLARCLMPGLKRYRLSSLVSHFGVREMPNHRALSDAAATAGVFLRLLKLLRSAGVRSVGEAAMLRRGGRIKPQKQHLAEGVPDTPGVYYFLDKHGTTLYVGKAKNLRARVRTYFNGGDGRRKVGRLVEEVAEVRTKETRSELRALILEAREIKRLLPRYNSAGRDDRASWFIRLDTNEPYPVPERVAENGHEEGVIRLGPYRSAGVLDACIEALGRIFPLRRCSGQEESACFYGQMGRCAPCIGVGEEEYRRLVIDEVVALLRGAGGEEHLAALVKERERLAGELEFEAAARLRDLIAGIERIRLTRAVVSAEGLQAVVAASTEPGVVEVFVLSEGRLIAHEGFEAGDLAGLSGFAEGVLARCEKVGGRGVAPTSDEARVVAAYLRRRSAAIEAVRLEERRDLLEATARVARTAESGAISPP